MCAYRRTAGGFLFTQMDFIIHLCMKLDETKDHTQPMDSFMSKFGCQKLK